MAPAIILVMVFLIAPFAYSLWLSMTNTRLFPGPIAPRFVGFDNFVRVLGDELFWQSLWNVARFTLMLLPLQCGFALLIAIALNQKLPFSNLFRSVFFLPAITSMVVVCVIWTTIFQYPSGPANTVLTVLSFGLAGPVDWLGDPTLSLPSIVLLSAWASFGFQMIVYMAGLQNIPSELYDAAKVDGAGPLRRFWHVTMPGLWQTHVFVIIVTTIQGFKLFTQVNLLTGGGPQGSTETLVHYMVSTGFTRQRMGYGSAVAILLFVLILLVSLVQRYLLQRRRVA